MATEAMDDRECCRGANPLAVGSSTSWPDCGRRRAILTWPMINLKQLKKQRASVCGGLTQTESWKALAGRSVRPAWANGSLGQDDGEERREMAELVNFLVVCG
jgi:hypothetical protein